MHQKLFLAIIFENDNVNEVRLSKSKNGKKMIWVQADLNDDSQPFKEKLIKISSSWSEKELLNSKFQISTSLILISWVINHRGSFALIGDLNKIFIKIRRSCLRLYSTCDISWANSGKQTKFQKLFRFLLCDFFYNIWMIWRYNIDDVVKSSNKKKRSI